MDTKRVSTSEGFLNYKSAGFGDTSSRHARSQLSCSLPKSSCLQPNAYNLHFIPTLFKKREAALLQSAVHQAHYGAAPHSWRLFILYVQTWNVVWELAINVLTKSTVFIWCTAFSIPICHKFFSWFSWLVSILALTLWTQKNDIKNTTTQDQTWCAKFGNQVSPIWTKVNKQLLNIKFSFYTLLKIKPHTDFFSPPGNTVWALRHHNSDLWFTFLTMNVR